MWIFQIHIEMPFFPIVGIAVPHTIDYHYFPELVVVFYNIL